MFPQRPPLCRKAVACLSLVAVHQKCLRPLLHYPALKNEHSVALTGLLETRSRVDWDALLSSLGLPNRKL